MIAYDAEIMIDRPAAEVFPYLAQIAHFPKWMGGTSTSAISDGPMRVGYRYRYQTDEGEFEMEVTDLEPGRRVGMRTLSGPFEWTGSFEVEDAGDRGSRVSSRGQTRLRGLLRLVQPFVAGETRKRGQQDLVRLKALVESAA